MKKVINSVKDKIKGKVPLFKRRSSKWDDVRDAFLIANPSCAGCGTLVKLEVHHIVPFHVDPSKELNTDNLITLCEDVEKCHIRIGHLGSFRKANPNVREDALAKLASSKKGSAGLKPGTGDRSLSQQGDEDSQE
jgi:5-methylcytosine-specific restriction endonuclease McrA